MREGGVLPRFELIVRLLEPLAARMRAREDEVLSRLAKNNH